MDLQSLQTKLSSLALEAKFNETQLVIDCPTNDDARQLLIDYEPYLALWASLMGKSCTVVRSGKKIRNIPASLAVTKTDKDLSKMSVTDALMFTNFDPKVWSLEWVRLFEKMTTCDRPQVLIRVADQRQLWCNNLFAEVMRSGGNEIVARSINDFWLPSDLEKLDRELKTGSDFQISYSARLNDSGLWGKLKAENKIYAFNGVTYRLSTNLECQLLEQNIKKT
jgi:hypothetical protein